MHRRSSLTAVLGWFLAFGLTVAQAAPAVRDGTQTETSQPSAKQLVKTIVFIGDSLTEGYGVKHDQAFPKVAERLLNAHRTRVKVINGGISGSVSADADRRVSWYLKSKPDIVVLALGANDGLKGAQIELIKANLAKAIDVAQEKNVKVLLCGMQVFSNLGADYVNGFAHLFSQLAREKKVAFMPFLLADVALKKDLNQPDGKHPNAKGHELVGRNVAHQLEALL